MKCIILSLRYGKNNMALKVWPCFEIFFICFFYLFLEQGCPWPTKRGNTVLNSCKILSLSLLYAVPLYVLNSLLWVYHCVVHSSPLAWLAVQDRTSWVEDYRNRRLGRGFIQLLFYRQRHLCAACEVSKLPWRMMASWALSEGIRTSNVTSPHAFTCLYVKDGARDL